MIKKGADMKTLELTIREINEIKNCDISAKENHFYPVVYNPFKNMSQRIKNIISKYQYNNESINQTFMRILKVIKITY